MAVNVRPVVLLAVMAVLAGCTGPGLDKVGGTQVHQPVVLTMASFVGDAIQIQHLSVRPGQPQTGTANVLSRLMLGTSRHLLTVVQSGGEVQCKLRILATVGHMNLASAASPATL